MEGDEGIPVIGGSSLDHPSPPHRARPQWWVVATVVVGAVLVGSVVLAPGEADSTDEAVPDLAPPEISGEPGMGSSRVAPDLSIVEGPGWHPVFATPLPTGGVPHLVGVVTTDGRRYLVTTSSVYEVNQQPSGLTLSESSVAPDVDTAVSVSAVGFGGSPVQVYPGIGGWTGRSRALENVVAVGVSGSDGTGPYVVSIGESDRWEVTSALPRLLYVTHRVDGVFVGQQLFDGSPTGDAVYSSDGDVWLPLPGWRLEQALGSGPVLRSNEDPTVVAAPTDSLPEVDSVAAPAEQPLEHTFVVADGLVAVDGNQAHFFSPGDGWTSLPLDVAHGAALPVLPLTIDPPRIASAADGLLVVSTWSE